MSRIVQNYQILSKIEEGGYGQVYQGINLLNQKQCAIKCYSHIGELELMRHEYEILKDLHHKNIISTLCYFEIPVPPKTTFYSRLRRKRPEMQGYLVMERGDTDFMEFIDKDHCFDKTIQYVKDILEGLVYIHGKRIIHADLKLENVVISKGVAKLVDFGMSVQLKPNHTTHLLMGFLYTH